MSGSQQKLGVPLTHGWWRKPRAGTTPPPAAAAVPAAHAVNLAWAAQRHDAEAPVLFPPHSQWWRDPPSQMHGHQCHEGAAQETATRDVNAAAGIVPKQEPVSPSDPQSAAQHLSAPSSELRVSGQSPRQGAVQTGEPGVAAGQVGTLVHMHASHASPTATAASASASGMHVTTQPLQRTHTHVQTQAQAQAPSSAAYGERVQHAQQERDQLQVHEALQRILLQKQQQHQSKRPTRHLSQAGRLWKGSLPTAPVATNSGCATARAAADGTATCRGGEGVVDLTSEDLQQLGAAKYSTQDPRAYADATDSRSAAGLRPQCDPGSSGPPASLVARVASTVPRSSDATRGELPSMAAELAQMVAKDRAKGPQKRAVPAALAAPAHVAVPSAAAPAPAPAAAAPGAQAAPAALPGLPAWQLPLFRPPELPAKSAPVQPPQDGAQGRGKARTPPAANRRRPATPASPVCFLAPCRCTLKRFWVLLG